MARRLLLKTGEGAISSPGRIRVDKDGKLGAEAIAALNNLLATIIRKFNAGLSWGNGNQGTQTGNLFSQYADFITPSGALTEFAVPHNLGKVPIGCWPVYLDKAAILYASSPGSWGRETIFLMCDTGTVEAKIILI